MGLMFAIMPVFYLISGLLTQRMPKWVDKRVYLISAAILNAIGLLLIGPSKVLSFPNSSVLIGIGQCLFGVAVAFLNIYSLPEMM